MALGAALVADRRFSVRRSLPTNSTTEHRFTLSPSLLILVAARKDKDGTHARASSMADFNAMAAFMKGSRPAGIHSDLDAETDACAGGHASAAQQQGSDAAEEVARQLFDDIDTDSDGAL